MTRNPRGAILVLLAACGGAAPVSNEVAAPQPRPDPMALCKRREDIAAPSPRAVTGYPLSIKTYTNEERAALEKAVRDRSPDWTSITLDAYGFLNLAATRPQYRAGPYRPNGEVGATDADVELVRKFVKENPDIFGIDDADRVVTERMIGRHIQPRFWTSGVISMQAFWDNDDQRRFWLRGRTFPKSRDASDVLAPWLEAEIVNEPLPTARMPCDPVSPDAHECAQSDPPLPRATVEKLNAAYAQKLVSVVGNELREVYWLQLQQSRRPCIRIPETIDAHTGEVLSWSPAAR